MCSLVLLSQPGSFTSTLKEPGGTFGCPTDESISHALMIIYRGNPQTTHFLNVDLDIYSNSNLQPLVSALGKKIYVLHVGRHKRTYCAHLSVKRITKDADSTIRAFCNLIESLPRAERELWNMAKVRDFNIGVQAETQPYSHEVALATKTVKAASEIGARIVFTVYSPKEHGHGKSEIKRRSKKAARSNRATENTDAN
jgi:hypothetical protein